MPVCRAEHEFHALWRTLRIHCKKNFFEKIDFGILPPVWVVGGEVLKGLSQLGGGVRKLCVRGEAVARRIAPPVLLPASGTIPVLEAGLFLTM